MNGRTRFLSAVFAYGIAVGVFLLVASILRSEVPGLSIYVWPLLGPLALLHIFLTEPLFFLPLPLYALAFLAGAVGVVLLTALPLRRLVIWISTDVITGRDGRQRGRGYRWWVSCALAYVLLAVVGAGVAIDMSAEPATWLWPMQSTVLGPLGAFQLALVDPLGARHLGGPSLPTAVILATYVLSGVIAWVNCALIYHLARIRSRQVASDPSQRSLPADLPEPVDDPSD